MISAKLAPPTGRNTGFAQTSQTSHEMLSTLSRSCLDLGLVTSHTKLARLFVLNSLIWSPHPKIQCICSSPPTSKPKYGHLSLPPIRRSTYFGMDISRYQCLQVEWGYIRTCVLEGRIFMQTRRMIMHYNAYKNACFFDSARDSRGDGRPGRNMYL